MVGTWFRTCRSAAAGNRRSGVIALLLCLAMLLPGLPVQPAIAGPDDASASSFRARQPDQPLIAFLRQGNLWLMNGDGSGQRQITISEGGVQRFSWSPSGQYIVILHESRLDLYDVANGEMRRLIEMPNETPYPQGRFPSWAVEADELLMEVSEGDATYAIVRIGLDGTSTPVSSYTQRQPCAGPSGAMTIMIDLLWLKELGSPFARDSYQDMVWWSDRDIAYINPFCATGVALDLTTGTMSEYPETVWLDGSADGRVLIQGHSLVGADAVGIFDPATGTTTPVDGGEVLAWSPTGEIVTTTVTRGPESAFSSRFDDVSGGYVDNTVDVWRSDSQGDNRQLVTTLDVQGTGVPSVTSDGVIIVGAVDNPTELMDVDESRYTEYSPEIYAEHQKILRIDPDGEVTVLLTNAYRPRLQPSGGAPGVAETPSDAAEPTDLTGTPAPTADATEVAEYPFSVPIVPYVCEQRPDPQSIAPGTTELPEGCTLAASAAFTVTGPDGVVYGSCTTPPGGGLCSVGAPAETDLLVTMDESTLPAGYLPIENPVPARLRNVANDADGAQFIILPADVVSAQAGTPPEKPSAPDVAGSAGVQIEPGRDWIAYVGEDGNIWLMQPDGSQQTQITTDGSNEHGVPSYSMPAWSPDGTILVFHKAGEGIIVYRDGTQTPVPNTARCGPAAVTLDNSRLLYSCASGGVPYDPDPTADQLATDPRLAAIASSNLDGTDARVVVPYALSNPGQNAIPWVDSGLVGFNRLGDLAVNPATGEILGTFGLLHSATAWIVEPSGASALTEIPFSDANQDRLGPFVAEFLPGGEQIVALVCEQGCYPDYQDQVRSIVILNRDGSTAQRLIGSETVPGLVDFTVSPDAATVVFATYTTGGGASSMLWSMPMDQGATPLVPGSSPAWQPNPDAASPGDTTGQSTETATVQPTKVVTETATEAATESGSAPGLTIEPGSDWIAYEGNDGNIWLMQPDGSQQVQVTTDGTPEFPYVWPTWSHGGTMLVFSRPDYDSPEPTYIYLFRDGVVSRVPNVHACNAAAFMPGDQQLVLGCGFEFPPSGTSDTAMQTDPSLGFVSMANLDGSDWRVHVPYHRASDGVWPNHAGGADMAWADTISTHPDGTIVVNFAGPHGMGMALLEPGSTTPTVHRSPLGRGAVSGRFFPGSDEILIGMCGGCYPRSNYSETDFTIAWADRNGAITTTLYVPDPAQSMGMPTISPDGGTLVFSTNRSIHTLDLNTGAEVEIATGIHVAWQPDASVVMERPASAVTSGSASSIGSSTTPATADKPAQAPSGAVPDQFIATWSGRGVQENPYGEWAVTISITGGEVGEIVGTSEYPEESCGGNLVLQEVTADSIVMREQLTYGQETCADGGTITLSGIDGGGCQFAWSGIGPYGTPSSAGGTLSRPGGANASSAPAGGGTAAQSGYPGGDGPPPHDTTRLDPYYIGTYAGTGNQTDPDNTWPITVTFTGGRPGEVIGTVEYPTLGCGGELILVSINRVDEWGGFKVTERITYGLDNCIDGGTFWFSSAESGIGITFSWTSPVSATKASGHLPEVEPGATSAPAEQVTESGGAEPVETDASSGGPPSIYDDPEAEPVSIEAEGG